MKISDESGMSWVTLVIIVFIIVVAIYLLITSGFFSSTPDKIENEVVEYTDQDFQTINHDVDDTVSGVKNSNSDEINNNGIYVFNTVTNE